MATCFDSIIGIKSDCDTITPYSGLYIEDIGITVDECDYYINEEYPNGLALLNDKISFAAKITKQTIANNFASHIKTKSLLESAVLGTFQDNLQIRSGIANTYGGISLTLHNNQSYLNVYVNSISLHVNFTGDIDVFAYNLITGELLDTFTVSCVANKISTKFVNKTYGSLKQKTDLIFVYDTEGIDSYYTPINGLFCTTCTGYVYSNYYVSSAGIIITDTDTKVRGNLTNQTHTYGLSINYSIQCSMDNWLCEIANLMALPILYRSGIEIMNYALLASTRTNSKTNIDYEHNQKRLEAWTIAYNDALKATLGNIRLPKNDVCFLCHSMVRSVVILP